MKWRVDQLTPVAEPSTLSGVPVDFSQLLVWIFSFPKWTSREGLVNTASEKPHMLARHQHVANMLQASIAETMPTH